MIAEKVTVDGAIEFLNSLLKVDREAISGILQWRVGCNVQMLNHPSVQVQGVKGSDGGRLSSLGILNGMFGVFDSGPKKGWGPIVAILDKEGEVERFEKVVNE